MFDWPEHTHTSPISTSRMRASPEALLAISSCGPPAESGGRRTSQLPSCALVT